MRQQKQVRYAVWRGRFEGFAVSALIFLIVLFLTGCNNLQTYYNCPHDISEVNVNSITEVPWFRLNPGSCGDVNSKGDIRILVLNERDTKTCMAHEKCHLHEYQNLNVSWQSTKEHRGWD